MADDPRVEAAQQTMRVWLMGLGSLSLKQVDDLAPKFARAALAAADEVQAPEVERLRAEVKAGITTELGSNATARRLLSEVRADLNAAEARYTALVEGVLRILRAHERDNAQGREQWNADLRALLPTVEEG